MPGLHGAKEARRDGARRTEEKGRGKAAKSKFGTLRRFLENSEGFHVFLASLVFLSRMFSE